MSLGHGVKIVTDKLLFAYDMGSRQSFKGAPVTNFTHWQNAVPKNSYSPYVQTTSGTWKDKHPDAIQAYNADGGSITGYVNTGVTDYTNKYHAIWTHDSELRKPVVTMRDFDASWKAKSFGTGKSFNSVGLGYGDTYTISWLQKVDNLSKRLRVGLYGRNTSGSNGFHSGQYGPSNTKVDTWERVYYTYTVATTWDLGTTLSIYMYGHYDVRATIHIADVQWEVGSVASAYSPVETRSNTESLLDWKGGNTVTANSLTYASDNTFSFNGSSNYIQTPSPLPDRYNWTIEFVAKQNAFVGGQVVLCPSSAGIDQSIRFNSSGQLYAVFTRIADNNSFTVTASGGSSVGEWAHYVVQRTPSNVKIYRNGVLEADSIQTGISAEWSGTWRIGQRGNSTGWLNGEVAIMRAYDKVLSSKEVEHNFNAIKGRFNI